MPDPKSAVNTNRTLRPGGFHHVALHAPDYDKAVAFYADVLGCARAAEWGDAPNRGVLLDAGDGNYVEIFEKTARGDVPEGLAARLASHHFAFRTQDAAGLLDRVRKAGMKIELETKAVTVKDRLHDREIVLTVAFFTGPCGELVELLQNDVL